MDNATITYNAWTTELFTRFTDGISPLVDMAGDITTGFGSSGKEVVPPLRGWKGVYVETEGWDSALAVEWVYDICLQSFKLGWKANYNIYKERVHGFQSDVRRRRRVFVLLRICRADPTSNTSPPSLRSQ